MNMYQINKGAEVLTGALTYNEGIRKLNEFKRADLDNAAAYNMDCFMPVKRETVKPAPAKRELPVMKTMMEYGIEFTSKLTEPGYLFVAFRTEQTAREIMESMNLQGFTVEQCENPTWIRVKQDY